MSDTIPRQHLGDLGLVRAFALLDLLGTARFRSRPVLGRNAIRVDQLLGEARFAQGERYDKTHPPD
jgi:hypothetical protein